MYFLDIFLPVSGGLLVNLRKNVDVSFHVFDVKLSISIQVSAST